MIVLKFGGTSMGTAQSIRTVAEILMKKVQSDELFVVVSAVGGITDKLARAAQYAQKGDSSYELLVIEIEQIHLAITKELIPVKQQSGVIGAVKLLINELEDVLKGIYLLRENSLKSRDYVWGMGERLSSLIIYKYMAGLTVDLDYLDPTKIITCTNSFGTGIVIMQLSKEKAQKIVLKLKKITICPGFIAGTLEGDFTTLGRGGSDYTAALFANFFRVSRLEIWSNVSGLMTADPRLVPNARVISHLSYEEALELSHFGARVIYPPTIQPALEQNIPIEIKNTFDLRDEGTQITSYWEDTSIIRGISSIDEVSLLNLSGSSMVGIPNFSARLFHALAQKNISVIIITQASSEHTICVGISSSNVLEAATVINTAFENEIRLGKVNAIEIENDLSIVALVGSNMKNQVGISGQMFNTLGKNGVNIKAIAQGSSERNITVVIEKKHLKKAVNALHESFFDDEIKKVNLFIIGLGNVGKAFLEQIASQNKYLLDKFNISLEIIGAANSRKMLFDDAGINPLVLIDGLEYSESFDQELFLKNMIALNLRNSIFVDITASEIVSDVYPAVLKQSISIVTPNKIAATKQFLFETNVGAGLPVLSTLSDLVQSGDRIHKIEAVLSGTLNFIFNHYDTSIPFVEIVKKAKEAGYTEPDPRLDLSGADVMRKILILARESGYVFEMDEVSGKSFLPESCVITNNEIEFYTKLAAEEAHFVALYQAAVKQQSKLRYVAIFENKQLSTGLSQVNNEHPFYQLEGKDNIVLFYTDRYPQQPLIIKGAGAGAQVTASGIFADVMRAANTQQ
jgi:bifunctional aspartokinase / homoserine dehydrogenase 1